MPDTGSDETDQTDPEVLAADVQRLTTQVSSLAVQVRALGDQLQATTMVVRLGQVFGPLLLLVVGALTPLIGFESDHYDEPDTVYNFIDAVWFYEQPAGRAIGSSNDAREAAGGFAATWVALILLGIALIACGVTCWVILFDRPGLRGIVALSVAAGLLLVSLIVLFLGQAAMSSLDPVGPFIGYWLLGAGAVWLLFGSWDANARRVRGT